MDKLSVQRIEQGGHPAIRPSALRVLAKIEAALTGRAKVRFTFVLRTWPEQAAIYAQGRTKPGPIVTHAQPGQSFHNYGLAIDIALIIDGKEASWDTRKDWDADGIADWNECVRIFKEEGWEWGGDWSGKKKDEPHFQMDFGYSWQDLKKLHEARKFIEGTTFVNLTRKRYENPNIFRTSASLNMRSGPGTDRPVIKVLLKGTTVREVARDGDWSYVVEVETNTYGSVSNKYLIK